MIAGLLNSAAITFRFPYVLRRCGEEMLVITNPATRSAANTFATARSGAGFLTRVVQTGSGPGQIGTTATAIQAYIRGQLNASKCIHPSYITIMGDDDLVPTFTAGPNGIPSDLPYAMRNDADELPDVAVGRILGNDQTQVGAAVTKIVGYETTPPRRRLPRSRDDRRSVPGRRQRRAGEPDLRLVCRDGAERPRQSRRHR